MEAFGGGGNGFDDLVQGALGDRGVAGFVGVGWLKNGCGAGERALFLFAIARLGDLAESGLELGDELGFDIRRFFFWHGAERGGFLGKFGAQQGMAPNDIVEVGLGEGGFVSFVVTVAAVAVNINHHIAAELLAKLQRDLGDFDDGEGIFAVHMENGGVNHLGDVSAVACGTGVRWERGEADLVVHNEMDCAAGAVALELRHVECLRNDALSDESGIAVDEDGNDFFAFCGVFQNALTGAGLAFDDRVDCFEMAGVCRKADFDLVSTGQFARRVVAEVVFYIPVSTHQLGSEVVLEFVKNDAGRLVQEIGQHIQSSAVRHAHDELQHAEVRRIFQNGIEREHEGFSALEGEAFLADILRVDK